MVVVSLRACVEGVAAKILQIFNWYGIKGPAAGIICIGGATTSKVQERRTCRMEVLNEKGKG